jgi:hypothetical protein
MLEVTWSRRHPVTYASVVSRESVRIILTLQLWIGSSFFRYPKCIFDSADKRKDLDDLRTWVWRGLGKRHNCASLVWFARIRSGFPETISPNWWLILVLPPATDPDVWMRKATKPDGTYYWVCTLLCWWRPGFLWTPIYLAEGQMVVAELSSEPDIASLNPKYQKQKLPNGTEAWAMTWVSMCKRRLRTWRFGWQNEVCRSCSTPLPTSYRPELDISPELDADDANYYQSVIGKRWAVELGRVDVQPKCLCCHLTLPTTDTLLVLCYICLPWKHNAQMVLIRHTLSERVIRLEDFMVTWRAILKRTRPGKEVVPRCFVDAADHAGDKLSLAIEQEF